jgi:hypothetical protein
MIGAKFPVLLYVNWSATVALMNRALNFFRRAAVDGVWRDAAPLLSYYSAIRQNFGIPGMIDA